MNHEVRITDQKTINLLLLEDDDVDFQAVERHLSSSILDINISRVRTLNEARENLSANRFDVVLADIHVPDSTGIETVARLSETCGPAVLMVVTGLDDPELERAVLDRGAQWYANKNEDNGNTIARAIYVTLHNERHRRQHRLIVDQMRAHQKGLEELSRQLKQENELLRNLQSLRQHDRAIDFRHLSNHLSKEALAMLAVETEQSSRAKSEFLLTVCHELRTSMEGILSIHDHLKQTPLTDQQTVCVDASLSNVSTLLRLVREASEIAKIESGRVQLQSFMCDLSAVIKEVAATASPLLNQDQVSLSWICEKSFNDSVLCDGQQVRQALILLLSNAIKYTSQGNIEIHGSIVSSGRQAGWMKIEVSDTGIGMNPETLESLKAAFSQGNLHAMPPLQTPSLGLAQCLQIVRLLGGEMGVESERWKGSAFSFTFPVDYPDQEAVCRIGPGHQRTRRPHFLDRANGNGSNGNGAHHPGRHVLVAHESRVIQLYLVEQLRQLGYSADTAKDGSNALYLLGRKDYDLLMIDCHLPVCDVFSIANRIRSKSSADRIEKSPPIIAISDRYASADRPKISDLDGFLPLPCALPKLKEVLLEQPELQSS